MSRYIIFIVFLPFFCFGQENYHTSPDKWKESRVYHSPWDSSYNSKIRMIKVDRYEPKRKILSSNNAYWFSSDIEGNINGERTSSIYIYNERQQIIRLQILNVYQSESKIEWINEKLLYIEWWWGRIVGGYLIFDIELETIIKKEMINEGTIDWQQYQK